MSPASGDKLGYPYSRPEKRVSIQLMSPASGDFVWSWKYRQDFLVSIQLMSPASGDILSKEAAEAEKRFPFN